jgi:hypothetical protein
MAPWGYTQDVVFTAPWGSEYGQYGQLIAPNGKRSGPQSLCAASDGRLFVLDTYNDGRVHVYDKEGNIQGTIKNESPSLGYGDMTLEDDRFLYLLDFSRSAVNRIDLQMGEQALLASDVLDTSAEIRRIGLDLKGRAFIEDASGRLIRLGRKTEEPLLAPVVRSTTEPNRVIAGWTNTKLAFPIQDSDPILDAHFLRLQPGGVFFFDVLTGSDSSPTRQIVAFDQKGKTRALIPLRGPNEYRIERTTWIDGAFRIYQLVCAEQDVRVLRWQPKTKPNDAHPQANREK